MYQELLYSVSLHGEIFTAITHKVGWTLPEDSDQYIAKDGTEIGWSGFDTIELSEPFEYDGEKYSWASIWGDGTLEFVSENEDSICWNDFPNEILERILKSLESA